MAHHPSWNDEATSRLWDYYSSLPDEDVPYFTRLLGDGLLNFADTCGILRGEVLDYGSGPGHLTKKLLDRGQSVTAVDFSERSCGKLRDFVGTSAGFRGVHRIEKLPCPFADSSFDLVVCAEVVEHLSDEWLVPTLAELYRLTKPGGHVLISTPCNESLRQAFVYCPFCDSAFHRWQHLRTFTSESLAAVVRGAGFEVAFCRGISLARFQDMPSPWPLRRLSAARFADWAIYCANRAADAIATGKGCSARVLNSLAVIGPELVCAAAKPMNDRA